jgi:hypothetical protein
MPDKSMLAATISAIFWAGPLQEHSKRPLIAQYAGPWLVHLHDYNDARLVLIGRNKTRRLSFRVKLDGRVVSHECSISHSLGPTTIRSPRRSAGSANFSEPDTQTPRELRSDASVGRRVSKHAPEPIGTHQHCRSCVESGDTVGPGALPCLYG